MNKFSRSSGSTTCQKFNSYPTDRVEKSQYSCDGCVSTAVMDVLHHVSNGTKILEQVEIINKIQYCTRSSHM